MKKIILVILTVVLGACEFGTIEYLKPGVITFNPQNVLTESASLGGGVYIEGGKSVTEYGLVLATHSNPSVNDTKIERGNKLGEFFHNYNGLNPATTYYYRAYAINEVGIGYGAIKSFTTMSKAPCNPEQENKLNYEISQYNLNFTYTVNKIEKEFQGYSDYLNGNVTYTMTSWSSSQQIFIKLNEYDKGVPKTGEYTVVYEFDKNNPSKGEAKLSFAGYNTMSFSGRAKVGTKFYVVNEDGKVNFIFCDTPLSGTFNNNSQEIKLNGKAIYTIPQS